MSVPNAVTPNPFFAYLQMVRRHLRLIVATGLASGLLAYYLTNPEFMQPDYEARAYIAAPNLKNLQTLNFSRLDYRGYGASHNDDLWALWSGLHSDSAFHYITKKFDLVRRYGLDKFDEEERQKRLKLIYDDKINVNVTHESTIELKIYDNSPQTAVDIANEFIVFADTILEAVSRRKASLAFLKTAIDEQTAFKRRFEDSLAFWRSNYGVYHFENKQQLTASHPVHAALFARETFHQNYDKVAGYENQIRHQAAMIGILNNDYIFRQENLKQFPTLTHIIAKAALNRNPVRPNRPLIAGLTALLALLTLTVLAVLIEKWSILVEDSPESNG